MQIVRDTISAMVLEREKYDGWCSNRICAYESWNLHKKNELQYYSDFTHAAPKELLIACGVQRLGASVCAPTSYKCFLTESSTHVWGQNVLV
jgi:hypothetical protein